MPGFSYEKAAAALTEGEMKCVVTVLLLMVDEVKPTQATFKQIGAMTNSKPESARRLFNAALQKLRDNDCSLDGSEADAAAPSTPAPKIKGRKRKAPADEAEGTGSETPKKSRAGKKDEQAEIKAEVDDGGNSDVESGKKDSGIESQV